MTPPNNRENPFAFALEDEVVIDTQPQIDDGLIDTLITFFNESDDFTMQEYGYSLSEIKSSLNEENRVLVNRVLQQMDWEDSQSRIQNYILELQNIIQWGGEASQQIVAETRDQERDEIESRFEGIFGAERWEEFRRVWNIEREDYGALDRILDLFWEWALAFLDTAVDLLWMAVLEWWAFSLTQLWNGLSYIIENDYEFFMYLAEKENNTLLYLWTYIHINGGFIAYRYMKDYLTTNFWEAINKRYPAGTSTRTVTAPDGSTTTENIETRAWVQRILGQWYLDAVSPATNIFNITDGASENLSAEQNEYLKRRHTMDILKSYHFDNPALYRRLIRIENTYMQSNTKTFWRSTYRLMSEHGLVRRFTTWLLSPDILKREMEWLVISMQQQLQRDHYRAIGLLFETSDSPTWVEIHKDRKTDFLTGLEYDINSDPSLTAREKSARITALNNYLNRITWDTIISEAKLYEELFRIRDGYATKVRMLEKIQAELDEVRTWGLIRRTGWTISDFLLRRRSNLRRFQQQISDGNWNGTFEEFEAHIDAIKSSHIIYRVSNVTLPERNADTFKTEMEARMWDVEINERLYGNSATTDLLNGIHYIVADNELETSMEKIYNEFMEAKTPYSELEFFRELERIWNGYLPSNILILRLEKAKADLVRQRPTNETTHRWLLDRLRNIRIQTADIPWLTPTQRVGTGNIITQAMSEVRSGNLRNGMSILTSIPNDVSILLWDVYRETVRNLNIAITARPTIEGWNPTNIGDPELERKISNVDDFMTQARNGGLDIRPTDIGGIKDWSISFDSTAGYISDEFTEGDMNSYKDNLRTYRWIDQFDFKAWLSGDTSWVQWIERALRERFQNEIDNLRILAEINGVPSTFAGQLNALARSLHENNYTRGQITPIIERLVAGESFASIDTTEIINNTTEHDRAFGWSQDIKDNLQRSFDGLDTQRQREIIDFIRNNNIAEEQLPENIKRGIERFVNWAEIDWHIANLNRIAAELETARNLDDINGIRDRFNRVIDTNTTTINTQDEEFRTIIDEFNGRFNELRDQFSWAMEANEQARVAEEVTRHTGELQSILDELNRDVALWNAAAQRRLERLQNQFDTYIQNNNINRTDVNYIVIIQNFEDAMIDRQTPPVDPGTRPAPVDPETRPAPQNEIVNTDIEAASRRARSTLRAAEIEILMHFTDTAEIQEKLNLVRGELRVLANDRDFLQRTVSFNENFAARLELPQIRSMQAIGTELWRIRRANPDIDFYTSSWELLDAIRNAEDTSALRALGNSIRNLRIAR